MAFSREDAFDALASLNPAQVFLDSYRVKTLPESLHIYFGPPEEFFIAPDTQELYTRNCLVPLLDNGNFDLITFLDPDSRELVQIDIESPFEYRAKFEHWQQYLAALLIEVGESIDDDNHLLRIADIVRFAHTAELIEYFRRSEELSDDAWSNARDHFPHTLRD